MNKNAKLIVYLEQAFTVGKDTFVDSTVENGNAVVFEDNCETGYFYALKRNNAEMKVLDGLHIYNVENVVDKEISSTIKIIWTEDLATAFLSINNYFHAVIDFRNHAGYCRSGFPETNSSWIRVKERKLTDSLLENLQKL
jgi:hypothetical protein